MTTAVSATFAEGKLRRRETELKPEHAAGLNGVLILAVGTRRDGITRYELVFSPAFLEERQRLREEPLEFVQAVECTIDTEDLGTTVDHAPRVVCKSDDASCSVRAIAVYESDVWLRL